MATQTNINRYASPGAISGKFGNPGDSFESRYMDLFQFPADIADKIACLKGKKIFCYTPLFKVLCTVLRELIDKGLSSEIKTYDGCYVRRNMRTGEVPSKHSWGMAVDFNQAENQLGGKVSFTDSFLSVWMKNGWYCGAYFLGKKDGMHFELSAQQLGL